MSVLDWQPLFPGRKADLLAFHADTPFILAKVQQTLFEGKGGSACVGLQKLAQQVALRLFTKLDGKKYENSEGCQLMTEAVSMALHTSADVRRAFEQSRIDVLDQFASDLQLRPDTPADEQLYDLQWVSGTLQGDALNLSIRVISQAGDSSQFTLPVTVS